MYAAVILSVPKAPEGNVSIKHFDAFDISFNSSIWVF